MCGDQISSEVISDDRDIIRSKFGGPTHEEKSKENQEKSKGKNS